MPAPAAFFLPTAHGQRLAVHHAPAAAPRSVVLFVHAFAEEMNKSRRMAALAARALAQAGHAVLQIDLRGCGDSSDDLHDASWADWLADVHLGVRWLRERHGHDAPLWLWGHRVGALVAAQAAGDLDEDCRFLFWQPSTSGKPPLAQFLRLKTVAAMLQGAPQGAAATVRQALDQGLTVDVAGYTLGAALARGLEAATLTAPPRARRAHFLELQAAPVDGAPAPPSPALTGSIARWRDAGVDCACTVVAGPAFWQTTEIEDAPALVAATVAALDDATPTAPTRRAAAPAPAPAADAVAPALPAASPSEQTVVFEVDGQTLVGVLDVPPGGSDRCVIVVVGGPQYRAGSHRLFVQLARHLAQAGTATLRFDVRGMGDSTGAWRGFEQIDADVRGAIDAVQRAAPLVRRFVLWGLCDGASAALMFGARHWDPRVRGLCLLNPWVRSPQGEARTRVRHYYLQRLAQPEFWRKLASGGVGWKALADLGGALRRLGSPQPANAPDAPVPFQQRMAQGWERFDAPVLLVLSGADYTAKEFIDLVQRDARWAALTTRSAVTTRTLDAADHTFSAPAAKAWLLSTTRHWIDQALPLTPA